MAIKPVNKKMIDLKTLGTKVKTSPDGGSTIHQGLASDTVPSGSHYAVRNNRLFGPFADVNVATDHMNWIAQREAELGVDY